MSSPLSIFNLFKKGSNRPECVSQLEVHTSNESSDNRRISMASTNSLPVDMYSPKRKLSERRASVQTSQLKSLSCCVEENCYGSENSSGYASSTSFRGRSCTTSIGCANQGSTRHHMNNVPNSLPTVSEPTFVKVDWQDALHARGNTQAYLLSLVAPTKRIVIHDPLRNKVSVYGEWNSSQDGSYPSSI